MYIRLMTRFIDNYLLYLMSQASASASAIFHEDLAQRGVPVTTWRILACLYPDQAMGISELANHCLAKQPTMTRQIDRLIAQGFVDRKNKDGDRRRVKVSLTVTGIKLAGTLIKQARDHEADLLGDITEEDKVALKSVLAKIMLRSEGAA